MSFVHLARPPKGAGPESGHNDLFSHATSKVDIDDISLTLNFFFNSPLRDDLLINFLVSVFTPYKNFTTVRFNLGKNVFETNIVALHDHIPQQQQRISLVPHSSCDRGRPRLNNRAFQKGRRRTKSELKFFFSRM
jgi:hypothetical protein